MVHGVHAVHVISRAIGLVVGVVLEWRVNLVSVGDWVS